MLSSLFLLRKDYICIILTSFFLITPGESGAASSASSDASSSSSITGYSRSSSTKHTGGISPFCRKDEMFMLPFTSVHDLCITHLDCKCQRGFVMCRTPPRTQRSWYNVEQWVYETRCRHSCRCPDMWFEEGYGGDGMEWDGIKGTESEPSIGWPWMDEVRDEISGSGSGSDDNDRLPSRLSQLNMFGSGGSCGKPCKSRASCLGRASTRSCGGQMACLAERRSARGYFTGGRCVSLAGLVLNGSGRKRGLEKLQCYCDDNRISEDCCWDRNGIIDSGHDQVGQPSDLGRVTSDASLRIKRRKSMKKDTTDPNR